MSRNTIAVVAGVLGLGSASLLVYFVAAGLVGEASPPTTTIVVEAELQGNLLENVTKFVVPLEKKIAELDGVLRTESQTSIYGQYLLTIHFRHDIDRAAALLQVRECLTTAQAGMSDEARDSVRISDEAPAALLVATLTAPDGLHDEAALAAYAETEMMPPLARTVGVAGVRLVGRRKANSSAPPRRYPGFAVLSGRPAMALLIDVRSQDSGEAAEAAVSERLAELRAQLPPGMDLELSIDRTSKAKTADYLACKVTLPENVSNDRARQVVGGIAKRIGGMEGVQLTLGLSQSPLQRDCYLSRRGFVVVRLTPSERSRAERKAIVDRLRKAIEFIPEAEAMLHDLAPTTMRGEHSVARLALPTSPDDSNRITPTAEVLRRSLEECRAEVVDVAVSGRENSLTTEVTLNENAAARLNLTKEQFDKVVAAALADTDAREHGRIEDVRIPIGGKMLPIAGVANIELRNLPSLVCCVDGRPATIFELALRPDLEAAKARARIEQKIAEQWPSFRLEWLEDPPTTRGAN